MRSTTRRALQTQGGKIVLPTTVLTTWQTIGASIQITTLKAMGPPSGQNHHRQLRVVHRATATRAVYWPPFHDAWA